MRRFWTATIAAALAVFANPAWADVAGRYETKGKAAAIDMEMTIETDDAGDVRAQMAGQPGYYLLTGGQMYSISRGADGPVVARMADVLAVQEDAMKKMGMPDLFVSVSADMPRMEFAAMGPEKVGPWQGTAYGVKSDGGKTGPYAAFVISDDPRIAPLGKAMVAMQSGMAERMASMMPAFGQFGRDFMQFLSKGTPVRMMFFELTDVSFDPISPDRFALPAPPESIDQLKAQAQPFPPPPSLPPRQK